MYYSEVNYLFKSWFNYYSAFLRLVV